MENETKICKECNIAKPLTMFYSEKRGNTIIHRGYCKPCKNKRGHKQENPIVALKSSKNQQDKRKLERANCINTEKYIYGDSRRDDKKAGRDNNLTKEWIAIAIKDGCQYCGDTSIRITLDRIDNTRGHTMDNVIPACYRCNVIRGNMPYDAWKMLCSTIKIVREAGAFGNWIGGFKQFSK